MTHEITQLISTVGFPIVACVYMAKYQKTTIDSFRKSIDLNTQVLQRVLERLSMDEKGD